MSWFLKPRPVTWCRLWLPVARGPEHPQARGAIHLLGNREQKEGSANSSLGTGRTTLLPPEAQAQTGGWWP